MKKISKKTLAVCAVLLFVFLLGSVGVNILQAFSRFDSYLQNTDEIYIMEAGILRNCLEFVQGEQVKFVYDMDHADYPALLEKYDVAATAGEGSELERALRLMDEYAPRLTHVSNFDNSVEMNALSLLEYSLDNPRQGINCRCKSQIFNEMCLALGIYSRKVWIMPQSSYDTDCHVVNEIWDTTLNKWVMLDITNNQYWTDENGVPLSVLEIRHKGAVQEFCAPVKPGDSLNDLEYLREKYIGSFVYIMKNMVYLEYLDTYTVGESDNIYLLFPENLNTDYELLVSEQSILAPPEQP